MNKIDYGGPAFPVFPDTADGHGAAFPGMTLRDHFAGLAMQGALVSASAGNKSDIPLLMETLSNISYMAADAMLKARQS